MNNNIYILQTNLKSAKYQQCDDEELKIIVIIIIITYTIWSIKSLIEIWQQMLLFFLYYYEIMQQVLLFFKIT